MLRALEIRDMLIIDRLDLAFQPGLNVLTGETGAGKSILLDSLGFVLGWRGRAELVRSGAAQGEVTAVFELSATHAARAVLEDAGLPVSSELILRRVNTADGRKTGWVNDRRASGEVLRRLSETLIELHGQHDDRGLLNPSGHRAILDDYAATDPLIAATRAAWAQRREARKALTAAEDALDAVRAEEDFLRHAVAELEKLAPEPGEDQTLDERRRMMQAAERIREDIARASDAIGYDGAEGAMSNALRWLEGASEKAEGRLDGAMAALTRAMAELDEAGREVADCLDALEFNPAELEDTEERLFALRGLARKHAVAPDDLAELTATLSDRLAALDRGAEDIADLKRAVADAETAYDAAGDALSGTRRDAAGRLDAAVAAELAPLRMERAVFRTEVTPGEPGPEGRDAVAFTVATNPGAPSGPLNKIASGGELSRFLLALKVSLSQERNRGVTMIFDEIDRGVGGATANAVGRRLKALADDGQVLVVTHSPQVAALGAHHWRVSKRVESDMTLSTVTPLADDAREDEIARMLSGDTVTPEARAAARALLGSF
ncbi:DNA recombination protein RecN [Salipiger aestuarii]|uniref:DNA repair protein RecN n=1 Tax=Salipiger aestuarii TaxID=568098 RepID=A0A327YPS1_9RHOB|nr:DNA repair protein RecN [Salipiger aestuarii]KAA8609648.1 DNA recombination protein RecN [Salipiger aestuarii]KAA8612944.1 DNA recombination protein RecN [Salipiger aestuarii]KAB2543723.1 DNA recombination protein RecN [Salipiger aestuarii]RAK22973.1 DNA replication and repair protein RecN [Salipiger aestuarii]